MCCGLSCGMAAVAALVWSEACRSQFETWRPYGLYLRLRLVGIPTLGDIADL